MWKAFDLKQFNAEHPTPDPRGFCFLFGLILVVLGLWNFRWNPFYFSAGVLLFAVGLIKPRLMKIPNRLWHNLGLALSWLMTPLFLSALYFIVFMPMALVIRLFGHKPFSDGKSWIHKTKKCQFERIF